MYLTYRINRTTQTQKTNLFDAILSNTTSIQESKDMDYPEYFTLKTTAIVKTTFNSWQVEQLRAALHKLAKEAKMLIDSDLDKHYTTFKIPKHNGKFRTIDAPGEILKDFLTRVKNTLQNTLQIYPHNAAFAYIQHRSNKHALIKHQYNESKWFLHLDLKDFFSNCTEEFIHSQLKQVFPFSEMYKNPQDILVMQIIIASALYKGRLPQGTPLSPYLTNIIMIPIDYALHNLCKQWNKQHFVYTRYADDIDISSKYEFDYKTLVAEIDKILATNSPLQINGEKIHYGSNAGRNWHLGLMLNQQNKITVGHKKKKAIKQKLMNYCTNKTNWQLDDIQCFLGELAYFKNIEPDYHEYLIEQYSKKYNQNTNIVDELCKQLALNRFSNA